VFDWGPRKALFLCSIEVALFLVLLSLQLIIHNSRRRYGSCYRSKWRRVLATIVLSCLLEAINNVKLAATAGAAATTVRIAQLFSVLWFDRIFEFFLCLRICQTLASNVDGLANSVNCAFFLGSEGASTVV
jgi:hypothetical protein